MNLASAPQVDVIKDFWDWVGLFAGLGGFVAAVVAILLASRAQKTATIAVTTERRRVFELEILRDLMKDLDESPVASLAFTKPWQLQKYKLRLALLSSNLPFWERIMVLKGDRAVIDTLSINAEFAAAEGERSRVGGKRLEAIAERDRVERIAYILADISQRDDVELMPSPERATLPGIQVALYELVSSDSSRSPKGAPLQIRDGEAINDGLEAWKDRSGKHVQAVKEMENLLAQINENIEKLKAQGKLELRDRLARDVQQEIWARVEAKDREA